MRLSQHSAHARFAKLGQELEHHLEQDMRERDVALKLRARLRLLEKTHRANVTRALDAAAIGSEAFSFDARDAAQPYVDSAIDALFAELRDVLEARILAPMISSSSHAYDRHQELHDEVLRELRREREEREEFLRKRRNVAGDRDGDGFVEDRDLDGAADRHWIDEAFDDEAAERRDEEWRKDVVANFVESFERHFNDTAMAEDGLEPRALLTEGTDRVFDALVDLRKRLGFPDDYFDASSNATAASLTWRDAERELAALEPQLSAARCHAFVPSPDPEDDEFDYVQVHNVERYVSDMIWHGKLNKRRADVDALLGEYDRGALDTMALLEALEELEGDHVFPSYWLYHSMGGPYDDYRYGDW